MDSAAARGSFCAGAKRSYEETGATASRKHEEGVPPIKKKLKTKLVDLFNRASLCLMQPEDRMNVYLRIKPYTKDEDSSEVSIGLK